MRTPAALALAALLLTGCGGGDTPSDEDQVRAVISDYAEAAGGKDPERVCDLIVSARGRQPPERCADRVRAGVLQPVGRVRVRAVRVRGTSAVAALEGGERVRLRRVGDSWRLVAPG